MGNPTTSELRYRRLFDRHSHEVFAYCRRRTDEATAADAAADTFTVAWRRLDDIPEGEAALGWLYGVARRVLANEFNHTRRSRRLLTRLHNDDPPADPTPEVIVVRRERDRTLLEALGRLRPKEDAMRRHIFLLTVVALVVGACGGAGPPDAATGSTTEPTTSMVATAAEPSTTGPDTVGQGCGTLHEPGEYEQPSDSTRPAYWMVVPETYDATTSTPLYLNLSAGCGSHDTNLNAWRPYLEAVPGLMAIVNTQDPNLTTPESLVALIDEVDTEYCVDRRRIHVMGMSWVSPVAERLACEASSRIASFASSPSMTMSNECKPGRPIALLSFTNDTDRGHAEALVTRWISFNGCDAEPDIEDLGSGVMRNEYRGCAADILLFDIQGAPDCVIFHEAKGPLKSFICEYEEVDYLEEAMHFFAENPLP